MTKQLLLAALCAMAMATDATAQLPAEEPAQTYKCGKVGITSLAISPKGDLLLAGHSKGADLFHMESGKKVHSFPFNEDGGSTVYHVAFNDNGEYVVLIGHTGKRTVWDVKSGKQDKVLTSHRWIPGPRDVKAMGLDMGNSAFDRFYQQSEASHGGYTLRTGRHGIVEFIDGDGKVVRKLEYPENKDQHHRAPLLFWEDKFFTGTDDGRVLVYGLL
jgi:WD40 repeat protein